MTVGTGWLILNVGGGATELKIRCETWEYDDDDKGAKIIKYPPRGRYGYTLNKHERIFKFKNIFVVTYADWNNLKQTLKTLEDTGTVINMAIQIDIAGNYEKPDGTNDKIPVIIKSRKGHTKKYQGEAQVYVLKMLVVEQAGALSAI